MKVNLASRHAALNHAARQYYIQSAEHALRYAPLPSFSAAIDALKAYHRDQNPDTHEELVATYETLRYNERFFVDGLQRSAITYFYRGLLRILESVIDGSDEYSTNDVFDFSEAAFLATLAVKANAAEVQHAELQFQDDVWKNTVMRVG